MAWVKSGGSMTADYAANDKPNKERYRPAPCPGGDEMMFRGKYRARGLSPPAWRISKCCLRRVMYVATNGIGPVLPPPPTHEIPSPPIRSESVPVNDECPSRDCK